MSDNISTISILKDFLTKEATRKRISLDINVGESFLLILGNFELKSQAFHTISDVDDSSVIHTLHLLHPKLEAQLLLAKQVALIEPLKDLASNEMELRLAATQTASAMTAVPPDSNEQQAASSAAALFSPEYAYILDNAERLAAEFKRQPAHLERLYGKMNTLDIGRPIE